MVGEEALRARQALVGDPEISPEPPDERPAEPIRQAVVRQRAEDAAQHAARDRHPEAHLSLRREVAGGDRKSTRLNSSHTVISYAVFCLKKKNHRKKHTAI